jgi:hypothetical protein
MFSKEKEDMVACIKNLDHLLTPLTVQEFGKLSSEVAERLKILHRLNQQTRIAGNVFITNL